MGFAAVMFDLDGLVLDTESTYQLAWQRAAVDLGHSLEDAFFEDLIGRQSSEVDAALRAALGDALPLEEFRALGAAHWQRHVQQHGIAVKAGVAALLDYLRDQAIPHALATNSRRAPAELCLRLAGLEGVFPAIVARDEVLRGKPEPDVYLEAARRLGVAPEDCLVLEDSLPGLTAAHRAGMAPVLVSACPRTVAAGATLAVRVLDSLERVIPAFFV